MLATLNVFRERQRHVTQRRPLGLTESGVGPRHPSWTRPARPPEISVLMPAWNCCPRGSDQFLRAALDSIRGQTFEDWELIVVDDGSTDETPEVLSRYARMDRRIRVIRSERHLKIVGALNRGLAECRAPLVARQDADDISAPARLALQKQHLAERPDVALCGARRYGLIDEEGALLGEHRLHPGNHDQIREGLLSGNVLVHGSVMFRKEVVLGLGGYSSDPRFEFAEDYELWVRVAQAHVIENISDELLYFYRTHPGQTGALRREEQRRSAEAVIDVARRALGGH